MGLIEGISNYSDIVILTCLLTFEVLVFIKLKFKVDKSGQLTLFLHLMVSILRIIDDIILIFKAIPAIIIWISLHYFTFEMWYIKAALNSDSFDVNLRNKNKITRIKTSVAIMNCFFLILYAINDS